MDTRKRPDQDTVSLIADYMEKGFLENILDMFRQDKTLYRLIGTLIQDERVRVRLGITALMEELRETDSEHMHAAIPGLLPLLYHPDAIVRGDAANLLGIAGNASVLPDLERTLLDTHPDVRQVVHEAIEEIKLKSC